MKALAVLLVLSLAGLAVATATGPDTVVIGEVSHWFEPVDFAHAAHADMTDSCADCHHDQEPGEEGACSDCHGALYDPSEPDTPDLKMAYHLQCLGCHEDTGATLECVGCHARAALPEGPELKPGGMR